MVLTGLPIEQVLDTLKQALLERDEVVLQAPPGAGKTTLVPLALLDQSWLAGKKILMLEPRRIAAKTAAYRIASLIDETPGQTIGYRMRLDNKVGKHTRVEIITEGILTRMLQQDPALESVGLVIFDEFHERNLDSDLALALCLQGRELFRSEQRLKILVMSATLDGDAISALLGAAPMVKSEGRAFPVEVIYGRARQPRERIVERMVATIKEALAANPESSLLAFLPGEGEIRRCADQLSAWINDTGIKHIHLRPLFGNLSIDAQQQAIAPLSGDKAQHQKVVLATNIAETSLTIEGVDLVVDSGLARQARFDPATGMTALHTVKISAASSEQRLGRAGRLKPGKCYRLWSAAQQQQLAPRTSAEILNADLAPLALQLLQWGVDDPAQLQWLDAPPRGAWSQAIDLLVSLAAIKRQADSWVLSAQGEAMTALPLHPRLAHLLICGARVGHGATAAQLASLLSERDPLLRDNPDIGHSLEIFSGETRCPGQHQGWLRRGQQLARQFADQLARLSIQIDPEQAALAADQVVGYLIACAYPERIARRRHAGAYQLANGRSASLVGEHSLGSGRWLAVAEVSQLVGGQGDVIRSAAKLDEQLFAGALQDIIESETIAEWDKKTSRFIAEAQQKIGALILKRSALSEVPTEARAAALIQHLRKQGLKPLSWTPELHQWCARVSLLHAVDAEGQWPDLSEVALLASLEVWLAPYLDRVNLLQDFKKLDLKAILEAMLPWEQHQRLEKLAPPRLQVPSGSSIAIDYSESPPVLAVKLQEMFGCEQTPCVVAGKVPLLVHLLSPARRPLQITQDLAGFWRSSYHEVKKDMKGRYPKHPWPDDPLTAPATRYTKSRS